MKATRILIFALLLVLPLAAAWAEDLVRVEVLVFKHSNGQSDRWPVDQLEDFSALIDPHERARLAAWSEPTVVPTDQDEEPEEAPQLLSAPAPTGLSALGREGRGPEWPLRFVNDEQLSPDMQRALDRLRASANHEVLSVTSWLQPLDRRRASPAVRIRDDRPVDVGWVRPPSPPLAFGSVLTVPEQAPPSIYQLDGSVRIRQRQFRHADLNLVWSESRTQAAPGAFVGTSDFEIHRLQQSRPIQLGRIEYFDSPWLGALILVEAWRAPQADGG